MNICFEKEDIIKLMNTVIAIHSLSKNMSEEELSIYDDLFNAYDLLYDMHCIYNNNKPIEAFDCILFSDKTVYSKYKLLFNS